MQFLLSAVFLLLAVLPVIGSSYDFSTVNDIVSKGIGNGAYPGAQLLIGNDDGIIFEKSYGNYTYDEFSPTVTDESIYDLASVTKVVATTSAVMKLYEAGLIDINSNVSKYLPEFTSSGKEDITVLNLLLHNSGLDAFVPFFTMYTNRNEVLSHIYTMNLSYPIGSKTVYSDLNAILLGEIVESVSKQSLDEYCSVNIFIPLGMRSTCFNPQGKLLELAVPTEKDEYWRMKQLKGEVHDEAAYLMGGVSGNAGLFSNSKDIYRLLKTLLKKGVYYDFDSSKEVRMFEASTVELFTKRFEGLPYDNTRALGWETKPNKESKYRIACGEMISENCFGHTGYTGTSIWCDVDRNLVVIFLTNRVFPTRNNNLIRDIRPDLHNAVINAFDKNNE